MTYSTGTGSYTDLMAAVLAHAITDGWTESGGVGTGWPIISPSGRIRGVDWTSYTLSEDDFTLNGDGLPKTQRYGKLAIGSSAANATTNLSANPVLIPNFAYSFTSWHIFSDISLNEHIHVVVNFSNGVNADCYTHFSFGEVDKGGLTYNSVAYATASHSRGYAATDDGGTSTTGGDWNAINYFGHMWAGAVGELDHGWANTQFMTHSTTAPHPSGASGWPSTDTIVEQGASLWAKAVRPTWYQPNFTASSCSYANMAWWNGVNSFTGYVPLGPIFFPIISGTTSAARIMFLGAYPNVRFCSMKGISPGDEHTFGSETWKFFPILRSSDWGDLNTAKLVTSGYAGYAYKKVA